jgi:plasmid stabilization system protein ParE
MARVILTRRAKVDFLQIWNYLAEEAGIPVADRTVRFLYDRCDFLANSPGLGELQPELGAGIRTYTAKKYVIFFERQPAGIVVLRVAHGSRDWSNLF